MMKKMVEILMLSVMIVSVSGCALFDKEKNIEAGMTESIEKLMQVQEVEDLAPKTYGNGNAQNAIIDVNSGMIVPTEAETIIMSADVSQTEEPGTDAVFVESMEEELDDRVPQKETKEAKDNTKKSENMNKMVQKKEEKLEESAQPVQSVATEEKTQQEVESAAFVQPVQAESGHVHEWEEIGRTSETNCFYALTTTVINYACISCGETKAETTQEPSDCDWQWVGEWQYGYTNRCFRWRNLYHQCVTHGTYTLESPRHEEEDNHEYSFYRTEPSCENKGKVSVWCNVCNTHFNFLDEDLFNETYPDGGGNGHLFVETGRRELDEVETWWYGEGKVEATFTCSVCGQSYRDIIDE